VEEQTVAAGRKLEWRTRLERMLSVPAEEVQAAPASATRAAAAADGTRAAAAAAGRAVGHNRPTD
jgi:hypothetical protein